MIHFKNSTGGATSSVTAIKQIFHPDHSAPDELTESLVVSKRSVVLLGKDMIDVLHAPSIQQLGGGLRLLEKNVQKNIFFSLL